MPGETDDDLAEVISEAVASTAPIASEYTVIVSSLAEMLTGLARETDKAGEEQVRKAFEQPERKEAWREDLARLHRNEAELLAAIAAEISGHVERLENAKAEFNIVLYGRTGSGKSTLIDALTHGDGSSASADGRLDHTRMVSTTRWGHCLIHDVPGIGGLGDENDSREELAERARHAVQAADIVLLCFDDQNQTAGEFNQMARWVIEYGKPAIAVLNVKNSAWRNPETIKETETRKGLSLHVAQHVRRIREQLTSADLDHVPVIALNALRAVWARAEEYRADPNADEQSRHDAETLARTMVDRYRPDRLEEWSNLAPLESLIIAALRRGATALRIGMVTSQLRQALAAAAEEVGSRIAEEARRLADARDRAIQQILDVTGEPGETELRQRLDELAGLRGDPITPQAIPSAVSFTNAQIDAEIEALRLASIDTLETLRRDAIKKRVTYSGPEVTRKIYPPGTLDKAASRVAEDLQSHLRQTAELVDADLEFAGRVQTDAVGSLDGRVGTARQHLGLGLQIGSAGVGLATGTMAVSMLFTPLGFLVAAGVVFACAYITYNMSREGLKMRRKAVADRRFQVVRAADDHIDKIKEDYGKAKAGLRQMVEESLARVRRESLTPLLEHALELRRIQARANMVIAELREGRGTIPQEERPAEILQAAEGTCLARSGQTARDYWLGASWIGEPAPELPPVSQPANAPVPPSAHETIRALSSMAKPAHGSGRRWLDHVKQTLRKDPVLAETDLTGIDALSRQLPRIVVFGDYSVGKTSFISRLLVEYGLEPLDSSAVGATPTTTEPRRYEIDGVEIVDTPGLRSGNDGHDALADGSVDEAAAVLFLLGPTLAAGGDAALSRIVHGDAARLPLLDRTVFVINRLDTLPGDPDVYRAGFFNTVRCKRGELREQISAAAGRPVSGKELSGHRLLWAVSAPNALPVMDKADAEGSAPWDGFEHVTPVFVQLCRILKRNGIDAMILNSGHALLSRCRQEEQGREKELREKSGILRLHQETAETQVKAAESIMAKYRTRLRNDIRTYLGNRFEQVRNIQDDHQRREATDKLGTWYKDPEFSKLIGSWDHDWNVDVTEWQTITGKRFDVLAESPAVQSTFARETELPTLPGVVPGKGHLALRTGLDIARDPTITSVLAAISNIAAPTAALVGMVNITMAGAEAVQNHKDDRNIAEARYNLLKAGDDASKKFFEEEYGSGRALLEEAGKIAAQAEEWGRQRAAYEADAIQADLRAKTYDSLIADARKRMGAGTASEKPAESGDATKSGDEGDG